jgi:lipopolysaccharide transport system permease protein
MSVSSMPRPEHYLSIDAANPRHAERALADLRDGLSQWRLAFALARLDLRNRYRGSVLGPFWVTMTTAAMVVALGFFYSYMMKVDPCALFPWLAISLILWAMISQVITEGAECFISGEGVIRQVSLPFTVHVLRCVLRNLLVAAHNLPLVFVVMFLFDISPGLAGLAFFGGLLIFVVNAFWIAFFLGIVCARFRDVSPIIASLMQLFFFITPIIWLPEQLGDRIAWLEGGDVERHPVDEVGRRGREELLLRRRRVPAACAADADSFEEWPEDDVVVGAPPLGPRRTSASSCAWRLA